MKRKDNQLIEKIREYLDETLYDEHSIQSLCRQFKITGKNFRLGFTNWLNPISSGSESS